MNLDSSKASGPDCIPVMVLKNQETELSCLLAELFNMCLRESCFPDCWKVLLVLPVFKDVRERSAVKTCCPAGLVLNLDALHAWSYKKKKHKKIKAYRRSLQKEPTVNRCLLILLSVVNKSLKNLWIIGLLIICGLFLISCMLLGLLNQLLIF